MNMQPYSDDTDLTLLQKMYPQVNLELRKVDMPGTIWVFVLLHENLNNLIENWRDIYNSIAASYQVNLMDDEDEFQAWNMYLFYLCSEPVEIGTKYKIENETFSSRKIVIDNFDGELNDSKIAELISSHITNDDLSSEFNKKKNAVQHTNYTSDSIVWDVITKAPAGTKKRKDNALAIQRLLNKIESQL